MKYWFTKNIKTRCKLRVLELNASILIELGDFSRECDLLISNIEHNNFDIEETTQRLNYLSVRAKT